MSGIYGKCPTLKVAFSPKLLYQFAFLPTMYQSSSCSISLSSTYFQSFKFQPYYLMVICISLFLFCISLMTDDIEHLIIIHLPFKRGLVVLLLLLKFYILDTGAFSDICVANIFSQFLFAFQISLKKIQAYLYSSLWGQMLVKCIWLYAHKLNLRNLSK